MLLGRLLMPNEGLGKVLFVAHFLLVWLVSICFLMVDYEVWKRAKAPSRTERKNAADLRHFSKLNCLLVDLPSCAALTVLVLYFGVHFLEHKCSHFIVRLLDLHLSGKPVDRRE